MTPDTTIPKSESSEYSSWKHMNQRTGNPHHHMYPKYGGRGIRVCAGWQSSDAFLADMGKKPNQKDTIDRKDNNGHYSCGKCDECVSNGWPLNCRWADKDTQMRNTSRTRMLTFNNQTMCVTDWAKELGMKQNSLLKRLKKWSQEKALSEPVKVNFRRSRQPVSP